jgi:hypothetical protein
MTEAFRLAVFVVDGEPVELVRQQDELRVYDELWARGRQLLISGQFRKSVLGNQGPSNEESTLKGVIASDLGWLVTVWTGSGERPLVARSEHGLARFELGHRMMGAAYNTTVYSSVQGTVEIDLAAGTAEIDISHRVDLSELRRPD